MFIDTECDNDSRARVPGVGEFIRSKPASYQVMSRYPGWLS